MPLGCRTISLKSGSEVFAYIVLGDISVTSDPLPEPSDRCDPHLVPRSLPLDASVALVALCDMT